METVQRNDTFESIPFPVRSFGGLVACRYVIHRENGEMVEVEAETAAEALQLSGASDATRIVRHMPGREVLIETKKLLAELQAVAAAPAAAPAGDATPAAA